MENNPLINTKNPWKGRKMFFIAYTGIFAVLSVCVFSFMLFAGTSLVRASDGFMQHLKALTYYGQWLRQLAENLFSEHRLVFPEFSFSLGLGSDVITTLHYYVIGDPLNLLAAFVPSDYMVHLFEALLFLRIYLAGLCFSLYCFHKGLKNKFGILAGAFVYTFCGFTLVAMRHPYFINPMIYFPLLLMGVDWVLANKRPYLLIAIVGVATVSNFYFLYILGILIVVYTVGQLISQYRHALRQIWKPFFQLVGCAVLGMALGAGILLPVLKVFLSDNRASVETANSLLYNRAFYSAFPGRFLSAYTLGSWTCGGFSAISLLAVFLLFMKRKQWTLTKIFFVVATIGLLIPLVGKIFNGFSYPTNRWGFAISFMVGFILAAMWPQMMSLTKKEAIGLFSCLTLYAAITFISEQSRTMHVFIPVVIAFVCLMLMVLFRENISVRLNKLCQIALLTLTLLGVFVNAFWLYSIYGKNDTSKFMDYQAVQDDHKYAPDNLVKSVSEENDVKTFFRYSGRSLPLNISLIKGTNRVQYYWSLSNPYIADFQREFNLRDPMSQQWNGFDDRTALLVMASSRYYLAPASSTASLPYGLNKLTVEDLKKPAVDAAIEAQEAEFGRELTESEKNILTKRYSSNFAIYENPYALPLGYTYSNYVTRENFDKLTPLAKQEALLQTAVLEETPNQALSENEQLTITGVQAPYTVKIPSNQVTLQDGAFVVTQANATVELILEEAVAGETYVSVTGLTYAGTSVYQLYNEDLAIDPQNLYTKTIWESLKASDKQSLLRADRFYTEPSELSIKLCATYADAKKSITKTLLYHTPEYSWYNDRHDFDVNLGYYQNAPKSITVTFPSVGIYSFDSLNVVCQPMTNYADQVNALREDVLENVSFATDKVTGTISLDAPKLLCLSIPYSEGWEAYVNGEPAQILQTNTMYMGLDLPAGEHRIQLLYKTPGLRLGMAVSGIALVTFLGLVVIQEVCPRLKKQKKTKEV